MKTLIKILSKHPLAVAAWVAFIISFFLPAYAEGMGWQCATLHREFWSPALDGEWPSIHYLLLTFPNLFMLASAFLVFRLGESRRGLKGLTWCAFIAAMLVWSFLIQFLLHGDAHELKIGAYVWGTSFVLLWLDGILKKPTAATTQT